MMGIFKKLAATATAFLTAMALSVSVAAEPADYHIDITKAHKTNGGGGQAFTYYLRNTNEVRKHGTHMDNAWITPDSSIILEWEFMGEVPQTKIDKGIEYPATLVLQCWDGEKVSATEQRWIELVPTTWDENGATFTYDDMLAQWDRDDLSDVYALVIIDEGTSLTVRDMIVTNLDIPDGVEYETLTKIEPVVETEPEVTEPDEVADAEVVTDENGEPVEPVEPVEGEAQDADTTEDASENTEETEPVESNNMLIIIIVAAAVVVVVIIIVIVATAGKKGKKKKGNYYD